MARSAEARNAKGRKTMRRVARSISQQRGRLAWGRWRRGRRTSIEWRCRPRRRIASTGMGEEGVCKNCTNAPPLVFNSPHQKKQLGISLGALIVERPMSLHGRRRPISIVFHQLHDRLCDERRGRPAFSSNRFEMLWRDATAKRNHDGGKVCSSKAAISKSCKCCKQTCEY